MIFFFFFLPNDESFKFDQWIPEKLIYVMKWISKMIRVEYPKLSRGRSQWCILRFTRQLAPLARNAFDPKFSTTVQLLVCITLPVNFERIFAWKIAWQLIPLFENSPAKTWEIGETLVKNRLPAIRFHPLFLGGRTLGEARVYISFTGSVSTAFLPSSATPPPSDGGGVYWKSWSPDQFPRDSSPCINGIATIPLGGSGLDAFVHSDTGKCTNDRRLWITISRLPNSMAVTWACTRMRTYGREREHVPNTWALLVAHLSYGFRGWGWGRGYGLRFYILTRVRLTWFPLHEGDRFDLVCLLNTAGLYQALVMAEFRELFAF